jgi:hypothetical protein
MGGAGANVPCQKVIVVTVAQSIYNHRSNSIVHRGQRETFKKKTRKVVLLYSLKG